MSSFWETHDESAYETSSFLSEDEIKELVAEGTVLGVVEVTDEETGQYGVKRQVSFEMPNGDVRLKSFSVTDKDGTKVYEGRARLLADLAAYLADGGEAVPVRLFQAGQAFGLAKA